MVPSAMDEVLLSSISSFLIFLSYPTLSSCFVCLTPIPTNPTAIPTIPTNPTIPKTNLIHPEWPTDSIGGFGSIGDIESIGGIGGIGAVQNARLASSLHASKRRSGAMARRKSQKTKGFGDDNTSDGHDLGSQETFDESTSSSSSSGSISTSTSTSGSSSESGSIYSFPPLYDLAFGYRDFFEEVDFLLSVHLEYNQCEEYSGDDPRFPTDEPPTKILELAAGPARHSLTLLKEWEACGIGLAVALDRSEEMVKYGMENADHELRNCDVVYGSKDRRRRETFGYVCGDMRYVDRALDRAFDQTQSPLSTLLTDPTTKERIQFDTAWILLGSMQHLLTNEDVISCFSSLHSVLRPGGTVVIELPHPRETFSMGECTRNGWTVPLVETFEHSEFSEREEYIENIGYVTHVEEGEREEKEYGELKIVWGEEDDAFDPVSQVRNFTVGLELTINDLEDMPKEAKTTPLFSKLINSGKDGKGGKGTARVKEIIPMRLFTLQEIDALARCAGLELVAKYGALAEEVAMEDEEEAFRMVCVLRKALR